MNASQRDSDDRRFESAASVTTDPAFLKWLRRVGICEGVSTLVLFGVAMPLKYLGNMPRAVTIVGSLHGALFVLLVVMFLMAVRRVPIPSSLAMIGIVAAVFPFGPFVVDRRLGRIGMP